MLFRIFLAFTLIPMLELYLLVQIGSQIGALSTVAIVVFTGMAGAWLARQEGMSVVMRIREQLNKGVMPTSELLDGACVLVAAVLLVTPGFITDIVGLSLLLPVTRALLKKTLVRAFERAVQRGQVHVINPQGYPPHDGGPWGGRHGTQAGGQRRRKPEDDDVIDV